MSRKAGELERVAHLWGQVAADRAAAPVRGWADAPIVIREVLEPRQSGTKDRHWLLALAAEVPIPRGGRWVSLGCGAAGTELFAAQNGLFDSLVALDSAEAALAEAARAATAAGVASIEFARADLNALRLPRGAFDVALMNMSLHHVKNLEGALDEVEAALKPGGLFIVNEFVGPTQFQFTDRQLAIASEVLAALPEAWRMDLTTGAPKTHYIRQPTAHWDKVDPSEAVRSAEIRGALEERFEVVVRRDYGGTILHLALEHIVHNFDPGDEKAVAAIRLLGLLEDRLIRHGVLTSDFTLMVLRKGARPSRPSTTETPAAARDRDGMRDRAAVLELENADLRREIDAMKGSRIWRAAQALRALVGRRW